MGVGRGEEGGGEGDKEEGERVIERNWKRETEEDWQRNTERERVSREGLKERDKVG